MQLTVAGAILKLWFPGYKTPPPCHLWYILFYLSPIAMTTQFLNTLLKYFICWSLLYSLTAMIISFSKIPRGRTNNLKCFGSLYRKTWLSGRLRQGNPEFEAGLRYSANSRPARVTQLKPAERGDRQRDESQKDPVKCTSWKWSHPFYDIHLKHIEPYLHRSPLDMCVCV